ncbi:SDR family NAD(P)-dependent oxidoreductase [Actomonas aquatica]|uniref:SDR family NAD(P)-dependent oxidoreductase n=1 Tax=Actomonas aquatica TaxID=2866162 RepID=A0ABZ1CCV6_9BACT|nr:SDR family NAD(P)-dependent oxidoreductase [Opitutus sp. WL0086]WRQ89504.1 SDR family NAD(P)-dependent oxidoreductase [Opitutus sp. WL0086]
MNLTAKRIILTGGTAGIGRELVDLLAATNELVVIGRDPAKLTELAQRYPTVCPVTCDLSDPTAVSVTADRLAADGDGFDLLLCNAAVQHEPWITAPEFDHGSIMAEVNTNFTSICQLVARLGPELRGRRDAPGAVVLVNSGLALAPKASSAVYCATKAALRSFGRSISYQLAARPVRVQQAYLPLVDTAMTAGRGQGKLSARDAATAILAGIAADKAENYIGQSAALRWLHRLSPAWAYRIMRTR